PFYGWRILPHVNAFAMYASSSVLMLLLALIFSSLLSHIFSHALLHYTLQSTNLHEDVPLIVMFLPFEHILLLEHGNTNQFYHYVEFVMPNLILHNGVLVSNTVDVVVKLEQSPLQIEIYLQCKQYIHLHPQLLSFLPYHLQKCPHVEFSHANNHSDASGTRISPFLLHHDFSYQLLHLLLNLFSITILSLLLFL